MHRKTRGCSASSSEQEGDANEQTTLEHPGDEWWKSSLRRGATTKPRKSRVAYSLAEDCTSTASNWLNRPQITGTDFSDWSVLKWWRRYGHGHPEIADLARRRLCAQASSATSERAFSKAGLIISKKRQRLTADHVDGISLLGWHYKDNGWGESAKRPRCVPQVEEERLEDERQMIAQ